MIDDINETGPSIFIKRTLLTLLERCQVGIWSWRIWSTSARQGSIQGKRSSGDVDVHVIVDLLGKIIYQSIQWLGFGAIWSYGYPYSQHIFPIKNGEQFGATNRVSRPNVAALLLPDVLWTNQPIGGIYPMQLRPFISYNCLFQWDYTIYKWCYKYL